ncbi:MAG: archaetidylinositol phosphate synthase [Candidatus Bathyarchaeota archaeon]|nr:archaetidylinositol phosphate synthase [Candidatus Bathyarchaeota archaeon]MDH5418977.1 archaetidylinositol phosphate synthase [Candidatus Bathyarchaeota archaeon]MDH5623130.1 archaetidylinositol phosphate synthase [Candidatus Bathyarchaeota archaeon]MDH5635411.1 archaetidylinositol phosphate synthase [Candidatus Bathyarchaeota archaeon]MDH5701408.1 archaetidylinositol phosphate synthase [Candidatus Bathyarchaeota archaeon]
MLTKLKQRVQSWMTTEAKLAHSIGLTPNQVSAIGIAFAVLSALAYWKWKFHTPLPILAPLLLLASGFCDAIDGALARIYEEATTFGGFLDSLLDRYADAIIFCGIILGGLCDLSWGLAALMGSLLVSYARARAEAAGVKMETVGIAERAERLVILVIASFLSIAWLEALSWGVVILAILTNLTVLQRVIYFRKASKQKEE